MHIRIDDTVEVISGEDRHERGKVLLVDHAANKVLVEGINRTYKHVRRSQKNPQGGRLSKEMPIPMSKLKLVCNSCGQATRTGARYLDDGSKERFCKKCSTGLGQIAPARPSYVKK